MASELTYDEEQAEKKERLKTLNERNTAAVETALKGIDKRFNEMGKKIEGLQNANTVLAARCKRLEDLAQDGQIQKVLTGRGPTVVDPG